MIAAGDSWLAGNLPPIIQFANANDGVIFLVWDEPEGGSPLIPFLAIGPEVKSGYASSVTLTHSALVKTVRNLRPAPPTYGCRVERLRRPFPARHVPLM